MAVVIDEFATASAFVMLTLSEVCIYHRKGRPVKGCWRHGNVLLATPEVDCRVVDVRRTQAVEKAMRFRGTFFSRVIET